MSFLPSLLAAFEFGSLSMLGWLAAAVLPWLIQRWNRRQHRTTSWAAVDLLLAAARQRSRQVKLQQWLLIAVRTAILVLVVLAAAEPVLRQWGLGAGGVGRTHTVVVVDRSYSMSLKSQDSSRLERAKAQARRVVESRQQGDFFSVIGWAQTTDNVLGRPTGDVSLVLSAIGSLSQAEESADLSNVLRAAQAAIERAESEVHNLDRHQVVFLSDMARNPWKVTPAEQSQISALAKRASLTVVDVGEGEQENVAIVDLSLEPIILLPRQEVSFLATLQGFGDKAWESIDIELSIDGRVIETQSVSLSARGRSTVRFAYQFDEEGSHAVQVSISDQLDKLPIDNQRWLVVEVRSPLRVACIAGKPGAADDVARALAPGNRTIKADRALLPEIVPVSRLGELDLSNYDAVFLCSATDLNRREAAQVTAFVQSGGGLAIFLEGKTVAEGLNQLMPVEVHQPVPAGEYRFDALQYEHPIVGPFRGRENAGLLKVAVLQYCRFEIKAERQSAERVLALDTGDPALVVDRFGSGRVAVLAIPGSLAMRTAEGSPWSSFAVSPSFLPIVRELVSDLVGSGWLEKRNLLVGQTATHAWDMSRRETKISVRHPDGSEQALSTPAAEDSGLVVLAETATSGVYQLSAAGEQLARFAVNLDTSESDLSTIDHLPVGFTAGPIGLSGQGGIVAAGYSFVSGLLAGAAVLLLLELALAYRLGRGWQ